MLIYHLTRREERNIQPSLVLLNLTPLFSSVSLLLTPLPQAGQAYGVITSLREPPTHGDRSNIGYEGLDMVSRCSLAQTLPSITAAFLFPQYVGHDAKPSARLLLAACSVSHAIPGGAVHKPLMFLGSAEFPYLSWMFLQLSLVKIWMGWGGWTGGNEDPGACLPSLLSLICFSCPYACRQEKTSVTFISSSFSLGQ